MWFSASNLRYDLFAENRHLLVFGNVKNKLKKPTHRSSHLICTQPGLRMNDHGWYHFSTTCAHEHSVSNHKCSTCSLQHQNNLFMTRTLKQVLMFRVGLAWVRSRRASETWRPSAHARHRASGSPTARPEVDKIRYKLLKPTRPDDVTHPVEDLFRRQHFSVFVESKSATQNKTREHRVEVLFHFLRRSLHKIKTLYNYRLQNHSNAII